MDGAFIDPSENKLLITQNATPALCGYNEAAYYTNARPGHFVLKKNNNFIFNSGELNQSVSYILSPQTYIK